MIDDIDNVISNYKLEITSVINNKVIKSQEIKEKG